MRIINLKDFNGIYFSPSSSIGIKVVNGAEKVSVEDDLRWEYPTLSDGKYHSTRCTTGYVLEQGKEYTYTRYEFFWLPRNNEPPQIQMGNIVGGGKVRLNKNNELEYKNKGKWENTYRSVDC